MKHFISSCILAFGVFFGAFAQETEEAALTPNRFGVGVRMGIGAAYIDGDAPFDDSKPIINLNVGAAVTYDLSPNFNLESGLYYTKKGYYYEPSSKEEVTCNLYYLQLPIMIGYKMSISQSLDLAFKVGPYAAYGTNGKTKIKQMITKTTQSTTTVQSTDSEKTTTTTTTKETKNEVEETSTNDSFDNFKRFDAGAKVAIDFTIKKDFLIGITYEHGLTNISDNNADAFNRSLALMIGFNF